MLLRDFGKARQETFLREAELRRASSDGTIREAGRKQRQLLKAWSLFKTRVGKALIGLGRRLDAGEVEPAKEAVLEEVK
jgi:hypothetical protein